MEPWGHVRNIPGGMNVVQKDERSEVGVCWACLRTYREASRHEAESTGRGIEEAASGVTSSNSSPCVRTLCFA